MIALALFLLLFVLILLRVPVAFSIIISGLVGLLCFLSIEGVFGVMEIIPINSVRSLSLSAIPLFILMAHLLLLSGMMDALFSSARAVFGRMPGASGVASTVAGVGFSAVTGSSTAAAATLAQTTAPHMIKEGYRPAAATGMVAAVGTLAGMIPPSVILVFYAVTAEANVGDIIVAGIVPGLIIAAALALTMFLPILRDRTSVPRGQKVHWSVKLHSLLGAAPVVVIFVVVVGLIYFGITTPTESAAAGCLVSFILVLVMKKATAHGLFTAVLETVKTSAMIFAIVIAAKVFGYAFALTRGAEVLVKWVSGLPVGPLVVILLLMVLFVILGFFMDQIAIIALTVPIVLPVVVALGYDDIWFGVFIVLMGEIGLITPPLGLNVFVVARASGRDTVEVFRGAVPYVIAMLVVGVLFAVWPQIVTWLPSTM
ncbi:TRAP transporter large permease [Brevibacterium sp. VCM10]|uniref:TRAP transporter large permease n=1 Tax=Brevibacterium sp. VCM10 TaxID=1381751 RepID=UPI0004715852|nr:TRAP transporter large permease [Brevibacterium sp. VCM10]